MAAVGTLTTRVGSRTPADTDPPLRSSHTCRPQDVRSEPETQRPAPAARQRDGDDAHHRTACYQQPCRRGSVDRRSSPQNIDRQEHPPRAGGRRAAKRREIVAAQSTWESEEGKAPEQRKNDGELGPRFRVSRGSLEASHPRTYRAEACDVGATTGSPASLTGNKFPVRSTDWFWIKQEDSCDNLINPRRPADNREGAAIIAYGAGALWHGLRTGTPGRLFLDQFGATRYARWRTTCVSMNASRCQEVPTASENALP
jgi:hypothetical protein